MEGPHLKLVSGSASIKPSMASNCSDENNQRFEEIGFDLNESNSRIAKISSTISAASKTNNSEKVLAERNDISRPIIPEINAQQALSVDLKPTKEIHTLDPGLENSDSSLSQSSPLSSYSYDPLTNYVSPRPKFLRYKPNRLREIYLRRENEDREEKEGLRSESMGSGEAINDDDVTSESRDKGFIMEDDDDDEVFEEVEEETCWNLKGVLKFMLLLLVLLSLTMYISSMNSPEPSMSLQAFGGFTLKDGYNKIQKHIYEFIQIPQSWHHNFLFQQIMRAKMGVLRLNQILKNDGFIEGEEGFLENEENAFIEDEEKAFIEDEETTVKAIGAEENNLIHKLDETMEVERGGSETFDQTTENVEIVRNQIVEQIESQLVEEEAVELEGRKSETLDEINEITESKTYDQMAENVQFGETKNLEPMKSEYAEEEQGGLPFFSGATSNVMEKDIEAVIHSTEEEEVHTDEESGVETETMNKNAMDLETIDSEAETKEKELFFKVIIGVSTVFTIITSLIWGYYTLKRKSIVSKESSSVINPCTNEFNPIVAKKRKRLSTKEPLVNSEMLTEKDECIEQVVSLLNTMSLTPNSMDEDHEELFQSRPPVVELLGEIVVGQSNRSDNSKHQADVITTDSAYMDSGLRSNLHLVPVRVRTDISELSTTVSSSYGSFTSDIIVRKQEHGGDKEIKKLVTTPVRRSSRIRNRVTSP